MDTEVEFEMTAALWEAAARRMWMRFFWRYAQWIAVLILCAFLVFPRVAGPRGLLAAMFLLVCAAGGTWLAYHLSLRKIRSRAAGMEHGAQVYRITDEGLCVPTAAGEAVYPWSQFHGLVRSRQMWLLFHGRSSAVFFPAEAMQGDVGEFVAARIRKGGGVVK
jgi:hypothetical protein